MTELYDLHCHSTASDGALSPTNLVQRAYQQGVTSLALTDHDTTAGLDEAQLRATEIGLKLITGIELSTNWQNMCFHIVGLGIDPTYAPLADATYTLQNTRMERAEKIAAKLEKKGIAGSLAAVRKAAGEGMVTRTHFSDFLLSKNHVSTQQEAFDRYLAKGKSAYVPTSWAELELVVSWITGSGGVAVLAHPLRYKLTANYLKRLLNTFKDAGGQGIEVITSRMNADEIRQAAEYATRFDLAGSMGSDFHNADNPWVELGRLASLPTNIKPIWELLN
jgi:predicted metal-dependent phosphoesterase TrpH